MTKRRLSYLPRFSLGESPTSLRGVVNVFVDGYFDRIRFGNRNGNVFLDGHGIRFLDWVRYRFLDGYVDSFVNGDGDGLRDGDVDGIRLRDGNGNGMRDVDGNRMRDGNSNVFDDGHSDRSVDFDVLSNRNGNLRRSVLSVLFVLSVLSVTGSVVRILDDSSLVPEHLVVGGLLFAALPKSGECESRKNDLEKL